MELGLKDLGVAKAIEALRAKFQKIGTFFVQVGATIGGVGAGITAAFKPAIDALSDNAKIADAADAFGLSAESASRLFGIMASGGSDVRDATEGLVTFNQRVTEGMEGTGEEAKKLFEGLGVAAQEFANLDSAGRFFKLLDALKAIPDPAKRVQLLLKAVGEDTGKNLVPLLSMTTEEMNKLGDSFESSAEDLKAAREATRAQKQAMAQLGAVWSQVATAIAPNVKQFAELVSKVVKPIIEWVKENRQLIATIATVGGVLTATGAALVGLGGAVSLAATGIGGAIVVVKGIVAAIGALLSPVGLAAVGVAALTAAFLTQTETGRGLVNSLKGGFQEVAGIVQESWGGIVAAISKGDLSTAGEIATTTLKLLWAKAVAAMSQVWTDFTSMFVEVWHTVTDGMGKPLMEAVELVTTAAQILWEKLQDGWRLVSGVFRDLKQELGDLAAFIAPIVSPIIAPFAILADAVSKAWEAATGNVMTDMTTLATFMLKKWEEISHAIDNALSLVLDRTIGAVAAAAEALDALTPGDKFAAMASELRRLQAHFGAEARRMADEESQRRIESLNAARDKIVGDLARERENAKQARAEARADDAKAADQRIQDLQAKFAELNARARVPGIAAGPGAGKGVGLLTGLFNQQLLAGIGSRGTFDAMQARQFGGTDVSKQQLDEQKKLRAVAEETVEEIRNLATTFRIA